MPTDSATVRMLNRRSDQIKLATFRHCLPFLMLKDDMAVNHLPRLTNCILKRKSQTTQLLVIVGWRMRTRSTAASQSTLKERIQELSEDNFFVISKIIALDLTELVLSIMTVMIQLFDHCLAPNTQGDGTGCDNMTCVIVQFKSQPGTGKRAAESEPDEASEQPSAKKSKIETSEAQEA
ncbi:Protein phosphatase 1G [Homalodisca vitripennis]|nr:Protein phosphatase 1G [Homalodisca vitripennis]